MYFTFSNFLEDDSGSIFIGISALQQNLEFESENYLKLTKTARNQL